MSGYGDDALFTAWLTANGYLLPGGAASPAVLRQRGSVYIDGTYGTRFVGQKAGGYAQEREWPRSGASVAGETIPDSVVPLAIIHASYEAALQEAREPESLSIIGSAAERVKREKVDGAVEVEYQSASAADFGTTLVPVMTAVEGLLAPFLRVEVTGAGVGLWSIGG
ncbi:DnaT-like ssDNA-binding protein [Devosia sp. MC1541]|uniref:DnaT-like ssDNA-binding protein n=1 Tax=Devosia sp. MC1541 TaxID=2725264 RepID=UPI00145ECA97|nr:DnaT-like ssDNA-binding protein [Devosia sp. MC1541]